VGIPQQSFMQTWRYARVASESFQLKILEKHHIFLVFSPKN
jgi:hypothetical protein